MTQLTDTVMISIVTYNSPHLFSVLDQLKKEIAGDSCYQICIFDNHSSEEYRQKLARYEDEQIQVVYSQENKGFGYGHNQLLFKTNARYAIIFNPDILVDKANLDAVIKTFHDHPDAAAIAPSVHYEDGRPQYLVRDQISVFDYFLRFIPWKYEKRLAKFECRDLPDDQITKIRIASGCFLAVDVEKFRAVKGFDERYFMYFEDTDLSLKFEKEQLPILYNPFIQVTHLYARASHKSFKMFTIFVTSLVRFFHKWGWRFF